MPHVQINVVHHPCAIHNQRVWNHFTQKCSDQSGCIAMFSDSFMLSYGIYNTYDNLVSRLYRLFSYLDAKFKRNHMHQLSNKAHISLIVFICQPQDVHLCNKHILDVINSIYAPGPIP